MFEPARGWMVTTQEGEIQKNCSNCDKFSICEKSPRWNYRVCKDYVKLIDIKDVTE